MARHRKAKVVRFRSPWEMIAENTQRMCKKAIHKKKCADGQKALRVKPTVSGMVVVNPIKVTAV